MLRRKTRTLAALCLAVSALTLSFAGNAPARASTSPPVTISPYAFTPGVPWADTSGNLIQGHNGSIISAAGTYYWIGQDISPQSTTRHSVACYSSTDLVHWVPKGDILTPSSQTGWPSPYLIGSVKVLYNQATKLYVLWASVEYGDAKTGRTPADFLVDVATSSQPCGSYSWVGEDDNPSDPLPWQPLGSNPSGDIGLFEDADGSAYLLSEDEGNPAGAYNKGLYIYALNSHFTDINLTAINSEGGVVEHFAPDEDFEAPAMFKYNGNYYVFASYKTNWVPNNNLYTEDTASTLAPSAAWSQWAPLVPAPSGRPDPRTCVSQTMDVLQVKLQGQTSNIYIGDRWDYPDLHDSGYVALPITFSGSTPAIDCSVSNWSFNTLDGQADVLTDPSVPHFTFTNAGSGGVMEEPSGPASLDVSSSNNGHVEQHWEIINVNVDPASGQTSYTPYYMIQNVSTGDVLEASSSSSSGLTAAPVSSSGPTAEQEWAFVSVSNPNGPPGLTLVSQSAQPQFAGLVVAQGAGTSLELEQPGSAQNQQWAVSEAPGYWAATSVGNVDDKAGTPWFGSLAGGPATDVVGIVPTPDGGGYFMIESTGNVTAFGDAQDYPGASIPASTSCPLAGATADPAGGFWVFGNCGEVYGGLQTYGSETGSGVHVVGMAASHDGHGYWLVDQNGTAYPFGDAGTSSFSLCTGCTVVSATTDPAGGFWALTSTGAVIGDGDVTTDNGARSLGGGSGSDFKRIAATADGGGYWLFQQPAGGIVTVDHFGDATGGTDLGTSTHILVAAVGEPSM